MKHVHSEVAKAKLDNMSLVVFSYCNLDQLWSKDTPSQPGVEFIDSSNTDYFLCLPQHKEVCLYWLNGGDVQIMDSKGFHPFAKLEVNEWSYNHAFMSCADTIRIAPKKEKRWIAVLPNGRTSGWHDDHPEELKKQYSESSGWQFIEIEVEV